MNEERTTITCENTEKRTPDEVMLKAEHLSKTYTMGMTTVPVLRDVMLNVRAGESVSVIGASGAGKSTLLHILGGIDKPTGGFVVFQGEDIYKLSAAKRTVIRANRIGFVFQFYYLLPELDLLENVMLPTMSSNRGSAIRQRLLENPGKSYSAKDNRGRARALLKKVGLADRANHLPAELSGGEHQRAALARALMNEPDLVLADEPTGNLDSVTGDYVLDTLFALTREKGNTLIMVTHNPLVAGRCDRTLKLEDGCLAFC